MLQTGSVRAPTTSPVIERRCLGSSGGAWWASGVLPKCLVVAELESAEVRPQTKLSRSISGAVWNYVSHFPIHCQVYAISRRFCRVPGQTNPESTGPVWEQSERSGGGGLKVARPEHNVAAVQQESQEAGPLSCACLQISRFSLVYPGIPPPTTCALHVPCSDPCWGMMCDLQQTTGGKSMRTLPPLPNPAYSR